MRHTSMICDTHATPEQTATAQDSDRRGRHEIDSRLGSRTPKVGCNAYISSSSAVYSHTTCAPYIRIWAANGALPYHFDLYPHAAFTYITYCTTPFLSSWIFIFTSPSSSPRSVTIARYVPSLFQRGFFPLHARARARSVPTYR